MRRIKGFLIALVLLAVAISTLWTHRASAAAEAAEFAPLDNRLLAIPAGTQIEAVINNGVPAVAENGDRVTAVVSTPVIVNGRLAIPAGAQLKGDLHNLFFHKGHAHADISFYDLTIGNKELIIDARPIGVTTPERGDFDALGSGLKALMGAGLGASLGASSRDVRMVHRAMIGGVMASVSSESPVDVSVVLTQEIDI